MGWGDRELRRDVMNEISIGKYNIIFYETLEVNGSFKDAVDAAYATLQDEQSSLKKEELETDFASEQEIQDTINDQINNPVGFQERIANWAEEKYKKYFIVINLWLLLWGIFVQPYLQENVFLSPHNCILPDHISNAVNPAGSLL